MHVQTTPFTLGTWRSHGTNELAREGWRGESPEWGEITVASLHGADGGAGATEVTGPRIPRVVFRSRGIRPLGTERPSLNEATLRVGGATVALERNRWAATHRGRALRMRYLGDQYRLWAVDRRQYVLMREADNEDRGVTFRVKESGIGKWKRIEVSVTGRALEADVALAVLFAGVDRSVLTRRGAVRAAVRKTFLIAADAAQT
ncbi:hypothetical protein [Streptomyces sp. NPDC058401]|uniref:hypothetical protein n=1 Tax=Streptomyces sp. NPDC058401 TaxID=3346480 RepID=UPI003654C01B